MGNKTFTVLKELKQANNQNTQLTQAGLNSDQGDLDLSDLDMSLEGKVSSDKATILSESTPSEPPQQTIEDVADAPHKPKTLRPTPQIKLFAAIVLCLMLVGSASYFYFVAYLPSKPQNLIPRILDQTFIKPDNLSLYIKTTTSQPSGVTLTNLYIDSSSYFGIDKFGNALFRSKLTAQILDTDFSLLVRPNDRTLYLKVSDIKSSYIKLLNLDEKLVALLIRLEADYQQRPKDYQDQWIELSATDLQAIGLIDKADKAKINQCMDDIFLTLKNHKSILSEQYNKLDYANLDAQLKRLDTEIIDGQKLTKYKLIISNNNLNRILTDFKSKTSINEAFDNCGFGNLASDKSNLLQKIDLDNIYLWSDGRKLNRLDFTAKNLGNGAKTNFAINFKNNSPETTSPELPIKLSKVLPVINSHVNIE